MTGKYIVFLDFDGVLATDNYDDLLLKEGDSLRDIFGRKFDPGCISSLKEVIESTGADIVITSSWRQYLRLPVMRLMWRLRKMPGRVVGFTPRISDNRGLEIDKWLARHPETIGYVILDDMDKRQFEPVQHSHLVTCDHFAGLSMDDAGRAIQILGSEL